MPALRMSPVSQDERRPDLVLWNSIKPELLSDRGDARFEAFRGVCRLTMFRATVLSATPVGAPSILVISIVDWSTPEVTLRVKNGLRRRVEAGSEIWFAGTPASFSKDPFMVTFDVEEDGVAFARPADQK